MSQANTLGAGHWAYVQTANCAIRRSAFEQVGGFCDEVRSGGDADICFRLRDAGWAIEPRERALVVHSSRRTLGKLLRQRARMGAGAAWLDQRHPGSFPPAAGLGWPPGERFASRARDSQRRGEGATRPSSAPSIRSPPGPSSSAG